MRTYVLKLLKFLKSYTSRYFVMTMSENAPVKIGATRSIYYSITDDVPDLTDEEKAKLEAVIQKAEEFEAEEAIRRRTPVEGQLYKYTNVMKGWQYRWFVLTPDAKMLEYYMLDDRKKSRPRGAVHLEGAIVTTNDEDSQSFIVSAVCGEVYKLKACDAKERQFWVDRIQTVLESEKQEKRSEAQVPIGDIPMSTSPKTFNFCKSSTFHVPRVDESDVVQGRAAAARTSSTSSCEKALTDPLIEIKESVQKSVECQKALSKYIESLPLSESNIKCSDCRLLLIKAISQASVQSLEQCYLILRRRRQGEILKSVKINIGASTDSLDKMKSQSMKKDGKKTELAKNL